MVSKVVKCRKQHRCSMCGRIIQKGEQANYMEIKQPRYEVEMIGHISIDKQVGIEYLKLYYCYDGTNMPPCVG
jgi:phage FluMu protein Com